MPRGRPRKNPISQVKILDKTFSIIKLFSVEQPTWTLVAIAKETKLPKTTAHRILNSLVEKQFLSQNTETELYKLGPLAIQIGHHAIAQIDIRQIARPILEDLSEHSRETAVLMMLSPGRDHVICTEQINNNPGIKLMMELGMRIPLHAGGSAKSVLAFMRPSEIDNILSNPMKKLVKNTIIDPVQIEEELHRIRQRGFAVSIEEINVGAAGIATPFFDASNEVIGSIGVIAPVDRFRDFNVHKIAEHLQESATRITVSMGG